MSAKTSDWRPGPTVCRCCLSEGCYKDISTEYFWMGKREVYAEMLSDTLDLSIAYSKSGPNSNSRLICEPCISRLRDAHDFKRQVLECEKTFMQHLDPGSESVQKEMELSFEEVKLERVKQEKKVSDDEDMDDQVDFVVNDDSDDDLDNEPLMKLATKVPKKEKEVDLLDLLDSSQITVKRKSTASTSKAKEPPAKKAKKREITIKPSASKATASKAVEKKKKEQSSLYSEKRRISSERRFAKIVVQNSTIYPFKLPRSNMTCIFCDEEFEEPQLFRNHMKENHTSAPVPKSSLLKVDCTELSCRICSQPFDLLQSQVEHLKNVHGFKIDLTYNLALVPFVLPNRQWMCVLCESKIVTLRALSKHMSMAHYSSVTCEECGKSFATSRTFDSHVQSFHKKIMKCRGCKLIFATADERSKHYKESRACWQSVCHLCGMRFMSDNPKEKHLQDVHNIFSTNLVCTECGEMFSNSKEFAKHFRIKHTDNKICCTFCPQMFVSKCRFLRHLVTHTKEKHFSCPVCDKAFGTQSTLNQHLWIHREEKRFVCKGCNKQFNQKVTWESHLRKCNHILHRTYPASTKTMTKAKSPPAAI